MRRWAKLWIALWLASAIAARLTLHLQGQDEPEHHLERALHFGFDAYGRNLALIVAQASFTSAIFAAFATFASIAAGTVVGISLSLGPPFLQASGMRFIDLCLAFPYLILALSLAAIRGPGWGTLCAALFIGTIPSMSRFVAVRVRELLQEEFVLAARAFGASPIRVGVVHLWPAVLSLTRIKAPYLFAGALLAEASLSFLGIGAPLGTTTWGSLLAQSRDYLLEAPHIAVFVGLPLVLTVLSFQVLAENRL